MKKTILLGALLVVANTVMAKEMLPEVPVVQEEVVEVEPVDTIVAMPLVAGPEKKEEVVKGESIYNIYGRIGGDLGAKYDSVKSEGSAVNKRGTGTVGYELGLESTVEVAENFEVGLGVMYQNHGRAKKKTHQNGMMTSETKLASYDSVPVYIGTKYSLPVLGGDVKPYLKANLGYSFNFVNGDSKADDGTKLDTKINNGLYYGVGVGVEYNNFFVDAMYQVNEAKVKVKDSTSELKKDYDYSRVTLGFGYKFSF